MLYLLVRLYLQKYTECLSGLTPGGEHTVDLHLGTVVLWVWGKSFRDNPVLRAANFLRWGVGPGSEDLNPLLVWPFSYENPWKHSELSSYQDVLPGKRILTWKDGVVASYLVLCKVLEGLGWADLTTALTDAKWNTSSGNTDASGNAKSPSWLHTPLPQGHGCQSWRKDMHFWWSTINQLYPALAVLWCRRFMAMKLRAGLMHNRAAYWHLLSSEVVNAEQSSEFPVRGWICDEFMLYIRLQIWAWPWQCSGGQGREVACRSSHCGEGKGAVAFISISCSVVERSALWVAMAGWSQAVSWKWHHHCHFF